MLTYRLQPSRATARRLCGPLAAIACLALSTAAGGQQLDLRRSARVAPCEMTRIEPGRPESAWAIAGELAPAEPSAGRFAILRGEAELLLLLAASAAPRELAVEARPGRQGTRLQASINGEALEARTLEPGWRTVRWALPASRLRAGPNHLLLSASPRGRKTGTAISALAVTPSGGCHVEAREVLPAPGADSLALRPGVFLVAEGSLHGDAPVRIAMRGPWPRSSIALFCRSADAVTPIGTVEAGRGRRRAVEFLDPPPACGAARTWILQAQGPGTVTLESARQAPAGFWTWRHRQRLKWALLAAGTLAGLALAARRGVTVPGARFAPGLDLALLFLLALALRLWMLQLYPYPGASGDESEYLSRALSLAQGRSSFWSDTAWHSWQTYLRPPGYYLMLTANFALGGDQNSVVPIQAVLSAVACAATYLIAYLLFGRGPALAAGGMFAFYLGSLTTFGRILTEPLYMALTLPALAALVVACRRASVPLAAVAGGALGLAALVRPGPMQFVLLAAALMPAIHGRRRGWRPGAALLLAAFAVVTPWAIRNRVVEGRWVGIETVSVANLLLSTPDPRFVPLAGIDLDSPEGHAAYSIRLKVANKDSQVDRHRGEIVRSVLLHKLRHPVTTARTAIANLASLLGPLPDHYLRWVLYDHDAEWVAWLTDGRNLQYLAALALGTLGMIGAHRNREAWVLMLWPLLKIGAVALVFHPMARFLMTTLPVFMVFGGWVVAGALGRLARASGEAAANSATPPPPSAPREAPGRWPPSARG